MKFMCKVENRKIQRMNLEKKVFTNFYTEILNEPL